MKFGDRHLKTGDEGKDVVELQLRLAGFKGTVWDGDFGAATELQVNTFQKDFMGMANPDGIVGPRTYAALDRFANEFPISFEKIFCPQNAGNHRAVCDCQGFGQNRFKKLFYKPNSYTLTWSRTGLEKMKERRHQYEYPGIHKAVLHTYRAFLFYASGGKYRDPSITSGYRCHINNVSKRRRSTNHMGKALDFTFDVPSGATKRDVCNDARQLLVDKSNCQIRWQNDNQKALEPGWPGRNGEFIATTWVHLDVRNYDPEKYLLPHFFVRSEAELDDKRL